MRGRVQALRALSSEYAAFGAAGNADRGMDRTGHRCHRSEYDRSCSRGSTRRESRISASSPKIEYGDKLGKLSAALDRRYLLDILVNPHLWDDPDERVVEVSDAVDGVAEQLVDNIKQVNARRGLHFQVSLDTLSGRRKELRDWDREFRRADGTGEVPSA